MTDDSHRQHVFYFHPYRSSGGVRSILSDMASLLGRQELQTLKGDEGSALNSHCKVKLKTQRWRCFGSVSHSAVFVGRHFKIQGTFHHSYHVLSYQWQASERTRCDIKMFIDDLARITAVICSGLNCCWKIV